MPMKSIGLIAISILCCLTTFAQTKKIVFVCEHGSAKSVIAAAYFNKLAREKNIGWEASARGNDPDDQVSEKTKKLLAGDKLLDVTFIPQQLSQRDVDEAEQVILFNDLPENIQGKDNIEYWLSIQSVNDDFQKLRNDIVSKIIPLLDSLAKK
jgi:hypothetical protein